MRPSGIIFLLFPLMFASFSFAHKNHHETKKQPDTQESAKVLITNLEKINEIYKSDVKPIFQRSCFDCHSQSPHLPWYHSLPIVHGLLENDMKEAKEHLDFTDDFPFKGHGSPKEDLEAIADAIRDKTMPPFRYKIMHRDSGLNDQEREAILRWTTGSQKLLEKVL